MFKQCNQSDWDIFKRSWWLLYLQKWTAQKIGNFWGYFENVTAVETSVPSIANACIHFNTLI